MIVAVPMDARERVYHDNPCTSTLYSLYDVSGDREEVVYRYLETRLNPWERYGGEMVKDPAMKACECQGIVSKDPSHISEHYIMLQAIGKCDVLIAGRYCLNTLQAMKNVGIKIHKVPPFVKTASDAIEHFVIAAGITRYLGCVRPS